MKSTAEIKKVKTGFRVRYWASNNEILAVSEILNTLANAKKNIRSMQSLFKNPFSVVYKGDTIQL